MVPHLDEVLRAARAARKPTPAESADLALAVARKLIAEATADEDAALTVATEVAGALEHFAGKVAGLAADADRVLAAVSAYRALLTEGAKK